jgi:long-chain-fatty-acid--[acyl-carrier-protein] ligase
MGSCRRGAVRDRAPKDIIIVGGQNVFPEDIEVVVNSIAGVCGAVVAFGIQDPEYGTENIAVVAEWRGPFDAKAAAPWRRQIHKVVMAAAGIASRYVAVVRNGGSSRVPAGKISRRDTRRAVPGGRAGAARNQCDAVSRTR